MKTPQELFLNPLWKRCIYSALAAATVPLLFLPACSLTSMQPEIPAVVVRQGQPASQTEPQAASGPASCSAVNFQATQVWDDPNPEWFGVRRQPDGSFTGSTYTADYTGTTVTKLSTIANVEQGFIACSGLASRARKVVPPGLNPSPLGIPSGNPIGVDLAGDGYGSVAGIGEAHNPNQLTVQRVGPDGTPRGNLVTYPVGTSPSEVVAGDFNGDGKKDLAVTYTGASASASEPGGVAILLGNGDGTLKPAVKYGILSNALKMTAFDFNGDGRTDLAIANYGGNVQIVTANADGSLHTGASYPMPTAEYTIWGMAAADMNGDHVADLLVATSAAVHILYGKGDATFTTGPIIPLGTGGSIGTGDFNQDGITDFAVTSGTTAAVYVYLGTGGGNFASPVAYTTPVGFYGSGVTSFFVEDFDGDGFPDIVFGSGHPDAVMTNLDLDPIGVLFGNGDGTFAGATTFAIDKDTSYQPTPTPAGVAMADFNGDGKLDLAASSPAGSIAIALGAAGGKFQAPATISLGTVKPTAIAAGAFSSDGKADLVVTDGVSNIYLLYHNGNGTFQQAIRYPTGGNNPSAVALGDFNGDKKLDVVVANTASNTIAVLPGFGDGSFNNPIPVTVGTNPVGLAVGDFNGDGKLDLAVANGGTFKADGSNLGGISVLLGKGDGTFQPAVSYTAYQYPAFVTAADVNGDGKLDLVVGSKGADGTDRVAVLIGTGNGTFQNAILSATSTGPSWITVADFDGDGKADLAVSHCCAGAAMATMQGNGDGTFQAEAVLASGPFFATAAGDFDGDHKTDLAVARYAAGAGRMMTVYRNITVTQGSLTITNAAGNPLKAPPIAAYSIATAKGTDLATSVLVNSAANPPTTLAGTTVSVKDAAGVSRPAQLFYVSQGQVNFLIPQATAAGTATVTVTSADGFVSVGTVAVTAIAPGIFTLNSASLAAAYVQRVHGDQTQSIEYLYAIDGAGNVTFPAIDLGPSTDQVYLNIFGTGLQGRSSLSGMAITVGGVSTPALYAGASTYPGEDQIAILLPRSLVGAGAVNIQISADGKAANVTTLNIK